MLIDLPGKHLGQHFPGGVNGLWLGSHMGFAHRTFVQLRCPPTGRHLEQHFACGTKGSCPAGHVTAAQSMLAQSSGLEVAVPRTTSMANMPSNLESIFNATQTAPAS